MRRHCALMLWPAIILIAGCSGFDARKFRTLETTAVAGTLDWRGLPLRDGQIIVTEANKPQSFLLSLLAEDYQPYVHAGLVVFDDGVPHVYEAWAIYKPRLHGRPTRNPGGGVRRVTLESFLERDGIIAIHDPPSGVDGSRTAAFARSQLGAPFDEFFDARDRQAFYCAEFVARALEAGGAAEYPGMNVSRNPSITRLLGWFEISAPKLQLAGELLRGTERRVFMDRSRSREQIDRYFARRRELHRSFTPDQRLGNVFRWNGMTLRWRPQLASQLNTP